MTFGRQRTRKPADVTLEGWVTERTDMVRALVERGRALDLRKAMDILEDLKHDIAEQFIGTRPPGANPCGEIPLPYSEQDS